MRLPCLLLDIDYLRISLLVTVSLLVITFTMQVPEANSEVFTSKRSLAGRLLKIIFPQMVDLAGAEYIDGKGHKDNFYHTIQVVDNIAIQTNDTIYQGCTVVAIKKQLLRQNNIPVNNAFGVLLFLMKVKIATIATMM